jgi:hypothetical protein
LSVTISGVANSLPRVSSGEDKSEYQTGDGLIEVVASHDYGKRIRRTVRINTKKIAADPFKPTENREESMSCYMVFDLPKVGYTNAEALAVFAGFNALLTASSNALVSKVLGGES